MQRVAVDRAEVGRRNALRPGRSSPIACAVRRLPASTARRKRATPVGRRQLTLRDQRDEQRFAGIRRRPVGEVERPRCAERRVAVALPAVLDAVAGELGVLAGGRRILERECTPVGALARRLQPVDPQPVDERRVGPALGIPPEVGVRHRRRSGEAQIQAPVLDVGLEQVAGEPRDQRRETSGVLPVERGLGGEEVGVGGGAVARRLPDARVGRRLGGGIRDQRRQRQRHADATKDGGHGLHCPRCGRYRAKRSR